MDAARYKVYREHTLVYEQDGSQFHGVLQGDVFAGGADWKNGPITCEPEHLRPATREDFERFRVSPKGHIE